MPLKFRPNFEKIVELLLYLAHKKAGADKYQVVKFFYLADRRHLNLYGRPITYEEYFALKYGPVASKTKDILDGDRWTMRQAKITELPFEIDRVKRPGKEDLVLLGKPLRDVDFDVFSKSDIRVFDSILQEYGNCSFDELFKLTHKHKAYVKAWGERPENAQAAPMLYEEMVESDDMREKLLEDLGSVAPFV